MTPKEIAEMLARDAEGVCKLLLPGGKRVGPEFKAGSVGGEAGESLSVRLTGDKAGVWRDFAEEGSGGDLIDLFAETQGLSIKDAIKAAKDYLGIRDNTFRGQKRKQYTKPKKPSCRTPKETVLEWLVNERKLRDDAIAAYALAEQGNNVVFPYLRDGELIRWKIRDKDDKHKCQTSSDSEPCLFGWQAIPEDAREVVICEGELDAVSWWQLGHPALSVPNGATGHNWIEHEFDNLERFDVIWIAMDNDEPGQAAVAEIVDRLGRERCRVIEVPKTIGKDANDLVKAGINALTVDALFERARTIDPDELKPALHYASKVYDIFSGRALTDAGLFTPWKKVGNGLRFRYGETIIVAGVNGHGKSEGVGHLMLDAMQQGERACVASLEFRPEKWLARITRQAAGMTDPTDGYFWAVQDWFNDKLWAFDVVGTAKSNRILEVFSYARKRYGIRVFVIDNLAKCGFDEDDYNKQKSFVDKLTDFAKEHDVIVFLVAHMRKGQDDSRPDGKMGVKGTGALTDMVDTVLVWWRNRKKEEKLKEAETIGAEPSLDVLEKPDAIVACEKQRNGEDEPRIALWFDKQSHQFLEREGGKIHTYVRYSEISGIGEK